MFSSHYPVSFSVQSVFSYVKRVDLICDFDVFLIVVLMGLGDAFMGIKLFCVWFKLQCNVVSQSLTLHREGVGGYLLSHVLYVD